MCLIQKKMFVLECSLMLLIRVLTLRNPGYDVIMSGYFFHLELCMPAYLQVSLKSKPGSMNTMLGDKNSTGPHVITSEI